MVPKVKGEVASAKERNTKFFRTSTIRKRCRNIILSLHDEVGILCYDEDNLKVMEYEFYAFFVPP